MLQSARSARAPQTLATCTPCGAPMVAVRLRPAKRAARAAAGSPPPPPPGFTSTSLGLEVSDVVVGSGPAPVKGQRVQCHYELRLRDTGAKVDSSRDRGQPLAFAVGVGEVIMGWDLGILGAEGIPPMKEGGKRILVVPPELGYGAVGAGKRVPPDATLLFEVELLPTSSLLRLQLADAWERAAAQVRKATSWLDAV